MKIFLLVITFVAVVLYSISAPLQSTVSAIGDHSAQLEEVSK